MLAKLKDINKKSNPFFYFICLGCGKPMKEHFQFRPDNFADARGAGRKYQGELWCQSDQLTVSPGNFQRI